MRRPVVETGVAIIIEPAQGAFQLIFVIALGKIFPRNGAPRLSLLPIAEMKADARPRKHVVKFERFVEISIDPQTYSQARQCFSVTVGQRGLLECAARLAVRRSGGDQVSQTIPADVPATGGRSLAFCLR